MRKILLLAGVITMACMQCGCSKNNTPDPEKPSEPISFAGTINLPTQVAATWATGSAIGVYSPQAVENAKVGVANYQANITSGAGSTTAQFTCTLKQSEGKHQFYAYTPYNPQAGSEASSVSGALKAAQTQRGDDFSEALKNSFLYAESSFNAGGPQNASFNFKNLFGIIEFTFVSDGSMPENNVSEISFNAGEGAVLAGNFTADLTAAQVVPKFISSQSNTVILTLANGGDLSGGKNLKAWMVVHAADYTGKNFTIEVKVGSKTLKYEIEGVKIEPNMVSPIELLIEDQDIVKLNEDGVYSNCYIVSQPNTKYQFDAKVQGNGKSTTGIAPKAIAPKQVFVIWETGSEIGNVIHDATLTEDGFVRFMTSGTVDGNAVIAITDGVASNDLPRGKVLWSWHIWAVNYTSANDTRCINFEGKEYTMMDRNVGDWTQPAGTMSVFNGLKYQWGRKDPFVGYGSNGEVVKNACVVTDPEKYGIWGGYMGMNDPAPTTPEETIGVAVAYPNVFFKSGNATDYDWYGMNYGPENRNNNLWGNPAGTPVKTIYDPCPKGYMVAPLEAFSGFFKTGLSTSFVSESDLNISGVWKDGWNFITEGTNFTFFPAGGTLIFSSGVIRIISGPSGASGGYWTSTIHEDTKKAHQARSIMVESGGVRLNTANRGTGESVRCIKE